MTHGPRERLITSAIALVRERGVEATGLTELVEHSGAARRSIYQHFPAGKLELIETSTRAAGGWVAHGLAGAATSSPRALVEGTLRLVIANLVESDFRLGCPIAAAAAAPPEATRVRAAAAEVFDSWTTSLAELLAQAGRSPEAARALAGFTISSIEGALMRSVAARSTEPLDQAAEILGPLLA